MSDCDRDLDCRGCWAAIFNHLMTQPGPILPRREFCQDAAYVAWVLDERLATTRLLVHKVMFPE